MDSSAQSYIKERLKSYADMLYEMNYNGWNSTYSDKVKAEFSEIAEKQLKFDQERVSSFQQE